MAEPDFCEEGDDCDNEGCKKLHFCQCGGTAEFYDTDPYVVELYPESVGADDCYWWCGSCYQDRCDDI